MFWNYFKTVFRFAAILKGGALAMLAEGAAGPLDAARDVILQLRDQFSPERSEAAYLANFGRSRGIVRNPLEPLEHWQTRVRFAYHWHLRGGRASALAEALQVGFGFESVEIIPEKTSGPLYDETTYNHLIDETTGKRLIYSTPDRWAEFKVIAVANNNEAAYTLELLLWAVNEAKPARSRCAGINTGINIVTVLSDELGGDVLIDETTGMMLTE